MGRNIYMKMEDNEHEDVNPTCISFLQRAIDHQQWRSNLEKILPHKKTRGSRKGHKSSNFSSSSHQGSDFAEMIALLSAEEKLCSDQGTRKGASTKRKSFRARIKKLISHSLIKERNGKEFGSISSQSSSQQDFFLHLADRDWLDVSSQWDHSFIVIPRPKGTGVKEKPKLCNEELIELKMKHASENKIKQDADTGVRKLPSTLLPSKAKARLIRSGTFPAANFSPRESLKRGTLSDKHIENWCSPRRGRSPDTTYSIKNALKNFNKDLKTGFYAENVRSIKHCRQLSLALESERQSDEERGEYVFAKTVHRRGCSLDESLMSFKSNIGKERSHTSTSLKLRNEDEIQLGRNSPVQIRKFCSFSKFEKCCHSPHHDLGMISFQDTIPQVESRSMFSLTRNLEESDHSQDLGAQHEMLETNCFVQEMDNLAESREISAGECNATLSDNEEEHDELVVEHMNSTVEHTSNDSALSFSEFPTSVAESSSQGRAFIIEELQPTEGSEKKCVPFQEESSINCQNNLDQFLPPCLELLPDAANIEHPNCLDGLKYSKSNHKDNSDADHIKDVSEYSCFTKDKLNFTWHLRDKTLIPSLYEEIEDFLYQELNCLKEDLCSSYHYKLLLGLVNEELVRLYDRSSAYYPKAMSSSCQIRQFPVGNHVLEEICSSISALMNLKPDETETIDNVVDLDLRRDDTWMNLQLESEFVALDIEDMIFQELLEEFAC